MAWAQFVQGNPETYQEGLKFLESIPMHFGSDQSEMKDVVQKNDANHLQNMYKMEFFDTLIPGYDNGLLSSDHHNLHEHPLFCVVHCAHLLREHSNGGDREGLPNRIDSDTKTGQNAHLSIGQPILNSNMPQTKKYRENIQFPKQSHSFLGVFLQDGNKGKGDTRGDLVFLVLY